MSSDGRADFRHTFVSILTAGLLAIQSLFFWSLIFAAIWFLLTDYEVFFDPDEVQSFPMQVAEVVVPLAGVVTNIIVAPWIAWTYLRSEPRRPSSGERVAAGLIVLVNLIWPLWIGLEIAYWPPDVFDVFVMGLALMTAVLVLSVSFSTRPVGLSAS